ncbi:hypothetical protein BDV95DRAFT_597991 [Massariosphaeria phaeospora]|uniref:Basic proline-rich protein n=1 Tax=Massariosphaeria phaeospora TaxID=100035 RepID=A0A7C8M4S8_9PLEO|nr:hypothetical protein BDV95DRAFT_597991 [Massariosphaeria phaeospora]
MVPAAGWAAESATAMFVAPAQSIVAPFRACLLSARPTRRRQERWKPEPRTPPLAPERQVHTPRCPTLCTALRRTSQQQRRVQPGLARRLSLVQLLSNNPAAVDQSPPPSCTSETLKQTQGPSCVPPAWDTTATDQRDQHHHGRCSLASWLPTSLSAAPGRWTTTYVSAWHAACCSVTMTAANLASPLPGLPEQPHADDLIQRLKAMTTADSALQEAANADNPLGLTRQLSNSSSDDGSSVRQRRPSTPRSQTDPSNDIHVLPTHHTRPRNRSPYSRTHFRSHSGSSSLSAPPMTRAHSLPTVVNPIGHLAFSPSPMPHARPSSPLRSPKRTRSPYRPPEDSYAHSGAPSVCDISEDAELELTPKLGTGLGAAVPPSPLSSFYSSNSLSRSIRRRPASPLHQVLAPFGSATTAQTTSTPTSTASSPLLSASKFNEPFPGMNSQYPSSHASSSMPSTPTSMRSRSPSISSLETIPDTPDAEAEATEADCIARLKAAVDRENDDADGARRSSLDVPGGSGRALGFGKRDSRKRWSVCGAERRGDLDLETIWED